MEFQPPAICVSICEETLEALQRSILQAGPHADIIELRLDCLDPLQIRDNFQRLDALIANSPLPVIVTYRPAEQGGRRELNTEIRINFWLTSAPSAKAYFDIELDIAGNPTVLRSGRQLDWNRVICSHHDLFGMPEDLDELYSRMAQTRASILKIAVQAEDATDCLPVFHLLERARAEGRRLIGIAMGEAGVATRILGPARGSFLTYAAPDKTKSTAAGQLTVSEIKGLYRIETINEQTEITGLVGNPVSHSLSPHLQNAAFAAAGVNAVYIPFLVKDAESFIHRMVKPSTREIEWNMRGLSVTAPHKVAVMQCLDWIDPAAKQIGAVNTIIVKEDKLNGYNTDGSAFRQALQHKVGDLNGSHCAVIGAGGAASAAIWALRQAGAEVTVFARDEHKARTLAEQFNIHSQSLSEARFGEFEVVVNATPLGTAGSFEAQTPATTDQLRGARVAFDLVYNPITTRFLREASAAGCEILGGLTMLVAQAVEQFKLWTGITPSAEVMEQAARKALEKGTT